MTTVMLLDLLRGPHLLGVILGMGTALYLDVRTLHRISQPITQEDINELHRIHKVVSVAFASLWITGVILLGYRTEFALASFSPKLWCKLFVVTVLTLNSLVLTQVIMPMMARYIGDRLIKLPARVLLAMSTTAGLSASCWMLAFALGYSTFLKTSSWAVLLPIVGGVIAVGMCGTVMMTFGIRGIRQRTLRT